MRGLLFISIAFVRKETSNKLFGAVKQGCLIEWAAEPRYRTATKERKTL